MIATPAYSQADLIVARLRREAAHRDHAASNPAFTPDQLPPPLPVAAREGGERAGVRGEPSCAHDATLHASVSDPEGVCVSSRGLSEAKPTENPPIPTDPEGVGVRPEYPASPETRTASTPAPNPPPTLSPTHPDWELFLDFLNPSIGLCGLCTRHTLSLSDLAAWLATPIIQATIETYNALAALRQPLIDQQIPRSVKATHLAILASPIPEDPRLAARHAETARKSATALTRLMNPFATKGAAAAARSGHARTTNALDSTPTAMDAGPEEALHPREGRRKSGLDSPERADNATPPPTVLDQATPPANPSPTQRPSAAHPETVASWPSAFDRSSIDHTHDRRQVDHPLDQLIPLDT